MHKHCFNVSTLVDFVKIDQIQIKNANAFYHCLCFFM